MWNPAEISEDWLRLHSSPIQEILQHIEQDTARQFPEAVHMLSGFAQGRLLSLLSKLSKPGRILEIGTFTGYGTICLAEGLRENGLIFTIEKNDSYAAMAETSFAQSSSEKKIRLLKGNALNILATLQEKWDLIYLDADKAANKEYLMQLWPKVNPGGLVLIDNVFARGGIMKPEQEQRNFEKAVQKLNTEIPELYPDLDQFILPIRDGLSILRKKSDKAS